MLNFRNFHFSILCLRAAQGIPQSLHPIICLNCHYFSRYCCRQLTWNICENIPYDAFLMKQNDSLGFVFINVFHRSSLCLKTLSAETYEIISKNTLIHLIGITFVWIFILFGNKKYYVYAAFIKISDQRETLKVKLNM